jgi:hypothetical protein
MRAQVLLELAGLAERDGDPAAARGAAAEALVVARRLGAQRTAEAAQGVLDALDRAARPLAPGGAPR